MSSTITLNDNQKKMYDLVVDESTQTYLYVLRGYAGTGKTVTLSKLITDSNFRKILVVAPTVKALSVLQGKLPTDVDGKTIDFSTMAKLAKLPAEQITVLDQVFKLNEEDLMGDKGLKFLLERLKIWDEGIITSRVIYKKNSKSKQNLKYIINEDLLDKKLKERFNGQSMMKPVEPVFNYKSVEDIASELEFYDLIMIDEMSMINDEEISIVVDALKYLIESDNSKNHRIKHKLIMAGDKGQLPPVEGRLNRFFESDQHDDVEIVELDKILRSTDEIAKIAQLIRKGIDISQLADTIPNSQSYKFDASQFCRENQDLLKNIDMALAFTNKDVNIFNTEIRRAKGFSGRGANEGEPMIVLENSVPNENGLVPFANGEEFIITKKYSIDKAIEKVNESFNLIGSTANDLKDELLIYVESGVVELIDVIDVMGQTKQAFIPIDFEKQYGFQWKNMKEAFKNFAELNDGNLPLLYVTYSYARTIHKSQGSEWNNTLLWLTRKNMWVMGNQDSINKRKLPYTGYTRAKDTCHLVYSNV